MNNLVPANPGVTLLLGTAKDGETQYSEIPIVAWNHVQGSMAFAITPINTARFSGRRGFYFPGDQGTCCVVDLRSQGVYGSVDDWLDAWLADLPGEESEPEEMPASPPLGASIQNVVKVEDVSRRVAEDSNRYLVSPVEEEDDETEEQVEQVHTGPSTSGDDDGSITSWDEIPFAGQGLTNNSFWSWPKRGVIFTVEGGTDGRPNHPEIAKVTREEFQRLKKQGAVILEEGRSVQSGRPVEAPEPTSEPGYDGPSEVGEEDDDLIG